MARVEEDIQQMEDRPLCEGRRKIADISASSKTSSHFKLFKAYGRLKMLTHKDKNSDSKSHSDTNELCRLEDSPFRLLKLAQNGNLENFIKAYQSNPNRLSVTNGKGQSPLHIAIVNGNLGIVNFILQHCQCLDAVDCNGDTALHYAVKSNNPEIIVAVMDAHPNTSILNNQNMAPLHLACDLGNVAALETLLKYPEVDLGIRGETGMRPLHYCSMKDNADCARILLKGGAFPCTPCDMGFFPIHIAAKCAAANTLEVLIQEAMKKGYNRETVLTFKDKENNMPLHAAVNGGNLKAVDVCLKAGAPVDSQQDDGSTPVHLAAAQGNFEMLKQMQKHQSQNFQRALSVSDAMNMTPLHRAALFNHVCVVEFLLQQGAEINSVDGSDRTPLLLAASKGSSDTVKYLLEHGADIHKRDENMRNFLHLAVRFGGKFDRFSYSLKEDIKDLLNEKDEMGCTPLHYASKEGHLLALEDLINMGAVLSPKNNEKQSPFHFATRYGRYNTCRRLLESRQGTNIINETDKDGLTGLHIAAQNGHVKVLSLLLQKGAVVHRDNMDNTPLHHAASQDYTQCIRILHSLHSNLLNVKNKLGDTALHVAAKNGCSRAVRFLLTLGARVEFNNEQKMFFDYVIELKEVEVAMTVIRHDRWEEVLLSKSGLYVCPFIGLVEHMPSVCVAVLDRCYKPSDHDKQSGDYYIEYNYKFLSYPVEAIEEMKKEGTFQPLKTLNTMVLHGRVGCLSHPVCVSFLKLKWNTYGLWVYLLVLVFYALFLACFTTFIVNFDSFQHYDSPITSGNNTNASVPLWTQRDGYTFTYFQTFSIWTITVYSVLGMVLEVIQLITQGRRYFMEASNCFDWHLHIVSFTFAAPFLFGSSFHWQWEVGAVAVFSSWFNLLVLLQRFDFFGIYVVMFLEILHTLLQALSVFSILIIAFGLSFYMLLLHDTKKAYSSPPVSMLRTAMMMLELDYMASFNDPYNDDDPSSLHFSTITLLMLAVFVLLMPILLMNLLIGLAVGDIESVQRNARLKRLAGQVQLHTDMERNMPTFLLARFDRPVDKVYPNKCTNKLISLWSRVASMGSEEHAVTVDDVTKSEILEDLQKQKQRLKETLSIVEKNNQLLRLVVQKMEIHTEDEAWDEGQYCAQNGNAGLGDWKPDVKTRRMLLTKSSAITCLGDIGKKT